jgi:hypothetical protein
MPDERSGMSNSQITVALIGAAAVIGSAVIANSDRIFGARAVANQPAAVEQSVSPAGGQTTSTPAAAAAEPEAASAPAIAAIAGPWRGDDGSVWEFTQDGDRFGSEKAEGGERVRIDGQVNGQSVRISVDYYQSTSGELGLRIMNCEGQLAGGGQQMQLSCLNPQTNVTSRATWSKA